MAEGWPQRRDQDQDPLPGPGSSPLSGLKFKVEDLGLLAPKCLLLKPSGVTVLPLLNAVTAASVVTVLNVAVNKVVPFLVHDELTSKRERDALVGDSLTAEGFPLAVGRAAAPSAGGPGACTRWPPCPRGVRAHTPFLCVFPGLLVRQT